MRKRTYPYSDKIREIISQCSKYFEQEPALCFARPTKRELAKVKHLEWVDEQLLAFGMECNGWAWGWQLPAAQQPQYPHCRGRVDIKRLQDIYDEWEGIVYFPSIQEAEPYRLATFKVVDFFADEACVGIYHDERRDPELYFYAFSEGAPRPLGVDFDGYLELMKLSLGYRYWAVALADLAQHVATQPDQPFTSGGPITRRFVQDMSALVPGFSLEDFVARYHQVRLQR